MCSVKPPPPVEIEKPTFVRNPYLDEAAADARTADTLRRGRSSLVIPTGTGIGFSGRGGSTGGGAVGTPNGNSRNPIRGRGPGTGGGNTGPGTGPRGPRARDRGGNHK